jgi:hypothetical protein
MTTAIHLTALYLKRESYVQGLRVLAEELKMLRAVNDPGEAVNILYASLMK